MTNSDSKIKIPISLEPWITVPDGTKALAFYTEAFGAVESFRMEEGGDLVLKLTVDNAGFWISGPVSAVENAEVLPEQKVVRMVLTVPNPDEIFAKAVNAGATEIFPVGEEYGWRLGRIADPFGLHWEIGHPL